jgi:hypothetical protein
MADRDNRRSAAAFRELIALRLGLLGIEASAVPIAARPRLSEVILSEEPRLIRPDIELPTLPGWHVAALASMAQRNLSAALDAAQRDASLNGTPHAALIAYRRDRGIGDAFVLQTLDGWASALIEAQEVRA